VADRWETIRLVNEADVKRLEEEIDHMNEILPPLEEFILPGGGPVSAYLHQARTVCRRAERRTVTLQNEQEINPQAVIYLNRLSDWLFVAGRWVAKAMGEPEFQWDRTR
jgi:cob(I)alamin adenosyltransferase